MPFINTKTNVVITPEQETTLKTAFGQAITLVRKSEAWLMLDFESGRKMYFRGTDVPCAMVEVKLYGNATRQQYDALTKRLTEILAQTLSISPDRIYVKFEEVQVWGLSGSNF